VAAHDVYYLSPEDREARDTLMAVQQGGGREKSGWDNEEEDFSFLSDEEMSKRFKDLPEAIFINHNTSLQHVIIQILCSTTLRKIITKYLNTTRKRINNIFLHLFKRKQITGN
jgi:DNA polymerase III alpha subunit